MSAIKITVNDRELFKESLSNNLGLSLRDVKEAKFRLEVLESSIIQQAFPEFNSLLYQVGVWKCSGPVGYCLYDKYVDPAFDDCIFCHEPDERK